MWKLGRERRRRQVSANTQTANAGRAVFVGDTYDADFAGPEAAGIRAYLIDPAHEYDMYRSAGCAWADLPLPPFEDLRHVGEGRYPAPTGHQRTLLEATLEATDLVIASPMYWYSVTWPVKLYLDYWSGWGGALLGYGNRPEEIAADADVVARAASFFAQSQQPAPAEHRL